MIGWGLGSGPGCWVRPWAPCGGLRRPWWGCAPLGLPLSGVGWRFFPSSSLCPHSPTLLPLGGCAVLEVGCLLAGGFRLCSVSRRGWCLLSDWRSPLGTLRGGGLVMGICPPGPAHPTCPLLVAAVGRLAAGLVLPGLSVGERRPGHGSAGSVWWSGGSPP